MFNRSNALPNAAPRWDTKSMIPGLTLLVTALAAFVTAAYVRATTDAGGPIIPAMVILAFVFGP